MTRKTRDDSAPRVASLRERRAAEGLERVELYVHRDDKAALLERWRQLREQRARISLAEPRDACPTATSSR